MGRDNVLLPVQEPIDGCFLRFLVDIGYKCVNPDFCLPYGFVIGLGRLASLDVFHARPSVRTAYPTKGVSTYIVKEKVPKTSTILLMFAATAIAEAAIVL